MGKTFEIRVMSAADVDTMVDWAAAEGWNPGLRDAGCFRAADPEGFLGGWLNGEMIASISVVNYGAEFSFLGFYIVHPDYRGKGYGYRLWQHAIWHAGARLIGLDGVVAEQENYRKSGFAFAYNNIRFGGPMPAIDAPANEGVHLIAAGDALDAVQRYDREMFPADRGEFVRDWISAEGHIARAAFRNGELAGYGVIRPARAGHKIGPLFADDPEIASLLLADLVSGAGLAPGDGEVFLDVPEPNAAAMAFASDLGLADVFETARMYTGPVPAIDLERIFGVTTFELG